jgi:hypothetical protein
MAIANRCNCGTTQLDNPQSIKENPFYMNCRTGEMTCRDCYVKEVSFKDSMASSIYTAGHAKQHAVLKKVHAANESFTAMRNLISWPPLNILLYKMQFGIFKKVQALSERFTAFRVRMVWGPQ